MRRLFILAILAMAGYSSAQAQDGWSPMPPGAIAVTYCLGGRVRSVIDMEVIGTDSLEEIAVHEATHREQWRRKVQEAGECPTQYRTPAQALNAEIEAYCASRPIRMKRGFTQQEVDDNYLSRLYYQFGRALPMFTIVDSYRRGCP